MRILKVFTSKNKACQELKAKLADLPVAMLLVDVDSNQEYTTLNFVSSVPTLKLFDNERLVRTHSGEISQQELQEFLK